MTEKVKSWWSDDGKWFCMLINGGQTTVSLAPEEAALLARAIEEVASPAVKRAKDFFWQKADQYDREKLQATYNDLLALQDQTDQVPLMTALDAVGLALRLSETKPFYGAECPSYPNCSGGCGLGCTHEIEANRAALARSSCCDTTASVLCSDCPRPSLAVVSRPCATEAI